MPSGLIDRSDIYHAQLMALIANVNRDTKKQHKPFDIKDFMLEFIPVDDDSETPKPRAKSWESLLATVVMLNTALGGVDKRTVK